MSLVRISESDSWIADYDTERGIYRVSYFEDGHFVDQYRFDDYEYKEVDNRIEKIINKLEEIKFTIKEKIPESRRNLDENGIGHFLDKLIDWIKRL